MRQLLSRRYSKNTPRLETFLQTIRRAHTREQLLTRVQPQVKTNFFSRSYSTFAPERLIGKFVQRTSRVSPSDASSLLSAYQVVAQRYRVLPTVEARDRTNYAGGLQRTVATSQIDARFTRSKSPRSRQYVLRTNMPVTVVSASALNSAQQDRYLQYLRPIIEDSQYVRNSRRTAHFTSALSLADSHTAVQGALVVIASPTSKQPANRRASSFRFRRPRLMPKFALEPRSNAVRDPSGLSHTVVVAATASATARSFALACTRLSREASAAKFDTFRAQLWYRLTERKMKRKRIARHWLKNASR